MASCVKDKVKVLGDNNAVKMIGPDGFTGYPDLDQARPRAQGMYLIVRRVCRPSVLQGRWRRCRQAARRLQDQVRRRTPSPCYAIYGVRGGAGHPGARSQKSDGTRKGVLNAVFSGDGHHHPGRRLGHRQGDQIDPATGDVNVKDISILLVKGNAETFFKAWPVS